MVARQQPKHVPTRTCVVCRDKAQKRGLVRLVHGEKGLQIDPTGKANGRGAYLCEQSSCWERAVTSDILAKALRVSVTADDRERLRQAMPKWA